MMAETTTRVKKHTPEYLNERIARHTKQYIAEYAQSPETIDRRLILARPAGRPPAPRSSLKLWNVFLRHDTEP
jgi:hypothetical protein